MRLAVLLLPLLLLCGMARAFLGINSCKEMSCYVGQNNAPKAKWRGNTAKTRFLGNKDYVSECEAACLAYTARGGVECKSFVWFDEPPKLCMMASSCWALQCHAVITDDWAPVPDDARAAVSGYRGIAATSMLNKAVTSVADGVVAGVNVTMSYAQPVPLTPQEQKAAAAAAAAKAKEVEKAAKAAAKAAADKERMCKKSGGKGCEVWYSAILAYAPQRFSEIFAVSIKVPSFDAFTNLPVAAGILSLVFLVTVIATLVILADDTLSTEASSKPAASAPAVPPIFSLFGEPAKKEETKAAAPPASFSLFGGPAQKKMEEKEKKTPSAAAANWFGSPKKAAQPDSKAVAPAPAKGTQLSRPKLAAKALRSAPPPPPPTEADQGLFGIKLPELPDISRLDELIPGNDKESKLRRLQESRKEAGAIDKDGAWLL